MEKGGKELKVSAIKNGTVLDHIPANQLFKVISILGLKDCQNQITFGTNLDSKLLGKKAIIKVSDRFFEETEINKVALVAPDAKINIIRLQYITFTADLMTAENNDALRIDFFHFFCKSFIVFIIPDIA